MQESHPSSDRQESSAFARFLTSSHSIFTPKRVGFTLAGAFVFTGTAVAIGTGTSNQPVNAKSQNFTVQTSSDNATEPQGTTPEAENPTTTDNTSSTTSNHMNVTVNGQNVAVPENGSVHQTVPTEDSNGQSSVSVSASNNDSNSSLNVNVSSTSSTSTSNSKSHSSSHTVITQNGSVSVTNGH